MSDFDDLFKDRFKDHEADVPEDMWSRIQANQAPEDVKKPLLVFWKWSVLGLLLITIIGIGTFYLISSTENTNTDEPVKEELRSFAFDPTNDNDFSKLLVASDNTEPSSDPITQNVDKVNHKNTINTVDFTPSETVITSSEHESIEDIIVNNNRNSTIASESISLDLADVIKEKSTTVRVKDELLTEKKNIFPFLLNDRSPDFSEFVLPDYDNKCPKFGNSYHGYYSIELYHGSDFNTKNLDARLEEYNDYALDRTETEKMRYSYSNGVKVKWHNNSGLELGMGLERSVIRERFEFMENAREVKVLISIDTVFSSNGSYTTSSDTTRIDIPGMKQNSITNKYTSIDIPIFIGYQYEINRWAIGLQAGIYINLLQQQNGRILGLNGKPAWIGEEEENNQRFFKSKTGLKFDGSISIVYHLTSNIDVVAQPYFRYNSHSYTNDSYPLEQYYHTAGIRAGVRYNFGF